MAVRLSAPAKEQIQEIWLYTEEAWGEGQATDYINGLFDLLGALPERKHLWRALPRASLHGAFCAHWREHLVFFRELPSGDLGILAVLHHRQDIPNPLRVRPRSY